jgi:hypothetical protein
MSVISSVGLTEAVYVLSSTSCISFNKKWAFANLWTVSLPARLEKS